MKTLASLPAAALVLLAAPAHAHHSNAAFDQTRPLTLSGKVAKVEWTNPHARFYVDVTGGDGATVQWNVELPSPNTLMRRGWRRDSLKEGEQVTAIVFPAREHEGIAVARAVTDSAGRSLFTDAEAK